jgi:hypothetical protein
MFCCLFSLTEAKERLPQRPQNLTPSANRAPQFVQATMPGITLESAVPPLPICEDEG